MNMLTKFQVDIFNSRTPAAPRTRRRILLSSTVLSKDFLNVHESQILITALRRRDHAVKLNALTRLWTLCNLADVIT